MVLKALIALLELIRTFFV
ncbi:damage-inducible type I toxin DinQ [Photorhabdus sp. RM105S]